MSHSTAATADRVLLAGIGTHLVLRLRLRLLRLVLPLLLDVLRLRLRLPPRGKGVKDLGFLVLRALLLLAFIIAFCVFRNISLGGFLEVLPRRWLVVAGVSNVRCHGWPPVGRSTTAVRLPSGAVLPRLETGPRLLWHASLLLLELLHVGVHDAKDTLDVDGGVDGASVDEDLRPFLLAKPRALQHLPGKGLVADCGAWVSAQHDDLLPLQGLDVLIHGHARGSLELVVLVASLLKLLGLQRVERGVQQLPRDIEPTFFLHVGDLHELEGVAGFPFHRQVQQQRHLVIFELVEHLRCLARLLPTAVLLSLAVGEFL